MIDKIAIRSLINRHSFLLKKNTLKLALGHLGKEGIQLYSDDNLPDIGKALSAIYFFYVSLFPRFEALVMADMVVIKGEKGLD